MCYFEIPKPMKKYQFRLPELGYQLDDLAPMMSQNTLSCHYDNHYRTYVENLNALIKDSEYEGVRLDELVLKAPDGPLADNAGQVLNHQLFFEQFRPEKDAKRPSGEFLFLVEQSFGYFHKMCEQMNKAAKSLFGSGWVWLAMDDIGKLQIFSLPNGDNPLRYGMRPVLAIDMWEHAYYLDYQNRKNEYLENFWLLVNWRVVSKRIV